ncbi:MAG TPA: ECF-type sigma factor [Gemmatimonadales bacterium]|nr:ECF-type sigma factor [Gemmatimonadales bacterium]
MSHTPESPLQETAPEALDALVTTLHDELRALARRQLRREGGRFTLQTTDLVHEAYLRLARDPRVAERGPAYFHAAAARAMRQVLIDAARRRKALKRGSGTAALSLDENSGRIEAYGDELLALEEAMLALEQRNPRLARTVECRYFGGMTVEETAAALGVSARTVKSDWALARAILHEALRGDPP